jgi:hypothetical protein
VAQLFSLGIITRMSQDKLGISTPGEQRPTEVPRSFSILTFFGMVLAAMFIVVLLGGRGAKLPALFIGVPLFPCGLFIVCKIFALGKSTAPSSLLLAAPYLAYAFIFLAFCFVRKWRWYWVCFSILVLLLVLNIAGCHQMLKEPIRGPE